MSVAGLMRASASMAEQPAQQGIRCFVAVDVDEEIKTAIAPLAAKLREMADQRKVRVSWTRREAWHVTLKFLGDVAEEGLADLRRALATELAGAGKARIEIRGLLLLPPGASARVVAAGVFDDGALARLAAAVERACTRLGFEPERRRFRPHLTLGRVRSRGGWKRMMHEVDRLGAAERSFGRCEIDGARLLRSTLAPEGARYDELERFELNA